jgi:hypothetical protein
MKELDHYRGCLLGLAVGNPLERPLDSNCVAHFLDLLSKSSLAWWEVGSST